MQPFILYFILLGLLSYSIYSSAQTPYPTITMAQNCPYSVINKDPVIFACSFTYSMSSFNDLTSIQLNFLFNSSNPKTIVSFIWANPPDIQNMAIVGDLCYATYSYTSRACSAPCNRRCSRARLMQWRA